MEKEYKYTVATRCMTYNHALYIEDALHGFIRQETTFPTLFMVVDDGSSDGEQDILRNWVETNLTAAERGQLWRKMPYGELAEGKLNNKPNISFVILLLSENHYKQNKPKLPYLKDWLDASKYHALCEGDDWWIDERKLQKQVEALEKNQNVDMCACGTICYKEGKEVMRMCPSNITRILTVEETICGGGSFLGTNSLLYREKMFEDNYIFCNYLILDYMYQIRGSLRGGILYLKDEMSAYRVSSNGSWVKGMKSNPKRYFDHREKVITALNILDFETNGLYNNQIEQAKAPIYINQILSGLEGGVYSKVNLKQRMKILLLSVKNLIKKK